MRQFWKELFPKKNAMNLFVYLLGHEGTRLPIVEVCSCLNIGRSNIYKLSSVLSEMIKEHKVPLLIRCGDGFIGMKKYSPEENGAKPIIENIIAYLNKKANTKYKANTKSTISHINARIKEGYKLEDFYYVIDVKCEKWMNTEQEQYLRPETLFSPKFNSYINERPKQQPVSKIEKSVSKIQQSVDWGMD